MNNVKLLLGMRIKILRKQRNLTQEKFSEMIDRSPNHLSKIESGEANPPLSLLIDIANKLEVDISELFNFETKVAKQITSNDIKNKLINIENEKVLKMIYKFYNSLLSDNLL